MIALLDYGAGNLFSLASSFRALHAQTVVTREADAIRHADKLVLPGVGAFSDAISRLRSTGLDTIICEEVSNGKPLLGICLGMQLLFETSDEFGEHAGLGLIQGRIAPVKGDVPANLTIPHIGWNRLKLKGRSPLFRYIHDGDFVYFVHSFYGKDCGESVIATTDYGAELTAAVGKGNLYGCQFHPEKSGAVGLRILKGFCDIGEDI